MICLDFKLIIIFGTIIVVKKYNQIVYLNNLIYNVINNKMEMLNMKVYVKKEDKNEIIPGIVVMIVFEILQLIVDMQYL